MFYGLHVKPLDNGKFEASSPDLPECIFDADSIDEATELATEMMPGAMELFYRQKRRAIPLPTPIAEDDYPIRVPTRVQAKILLWNYMVNNRYRVADMAPMPNVSPTPQKGEEARMLNVSQTQAQRLVDLTKDGASMEALDDAFDMLGMAFTLTTEKKA